MTTKDFYLSAYLIATGFPLLSANKSAGLTIFEFAETPKLNNTISNYYSFNSSVEPILYGNAMRNLKTIIHSNATNQYHSQQ